MKRINIPIAALDSATRGVMHHWQHPRPFIECDIKCVFFIPPLDRQFSRKPDQLPANSSFEQGTLPLLSEENARNRIGDGLRS
ncbi:hypothetical protein [Paraburkholderia sp. 32]|uniref:hypothetical protein n=1 Tax=Paraburkholderia sp. 32 TaxID=2991057 RepID=UPI003D1EF749